MKGGMILMTQPACSVTQSCPTLCDPVDCSPPGSSIPGVLQARPPEWVHDTGLLPRRLGGRPTCEMTLPSAGTPACGPRNSKLPNAHLPAVLEGDHMWLGMFMLTKSFLFAAV